MLDVSFNPLHGRLPTIASEDAPPSWKHPPPLVSVRVSGAKLSGPLPSDWAMIEPLKELRLDG